MRAALLACAALSGCMSTQPLRTSEMLAPIAVLRPEVMADNGNAKLVVKRDQYSGPPGCSARIAIDGKESFDLAGMQGVSLRMPPGKHVISMTAPTFACLSSDDEISVLLEPGKTAAVRVTVSPRDPNRFKLLETAFID